MKRFPGKFGRLLGLQSDRKDQASLAWEKLCGGVEAASAGCHEHAVALFSAALELAPQAPAGIYHHRGAALAELGMYRQAIRDYDTAVRLNPRYPDTYLDRGNAHHALSEPQHALKDYSEAIRLRPNFAEAHANRAVVQMERGDVEAARADAEKARAFGIDQNALDKLLRVAAASEIPRP